MHPTGEQRAATGDGCSEVVIGQMKLTAATGIKDARFQEIADLANILLTTALDMWRRSWTPAGANASYGPVSWTVVDWPGPANPPEKRKADGLRPIP